MMRKIKTYSHLILEKPFEVIDENTLIIASEDTIIKTNLLTNESTILCRAQIYWFICLKNDEIVYQTENGGYLYFIDFKNNQHVIEGKKFFLARAKELKEGLIIGAKNIETKKHEDYLINIEDKTISELFLPFYPSKTLPNNTFLVLSHTIYCYSLYNPDIWQLPITDLISSENISVYRDIVFYDNKLYFYLNDYKYFPNSASFCVDANTGQVLHRYDDFTGGLYLFGNKIGNTSDKTVKILDTVTNQITIKDYTRFLVPYKLSFSFSQNIFTSDNLLYFVASGDHQSSHVGIIDLEKDELLWLHSLNEGREKYDLSAMKIQVHGNHFYIHCSDDTLHIFENESQ